MKLLDFIIYYAIARCIYDVGMLIVKLILDKNDNYVEGQ